MRMPNLLTGLQGKSQVVQDELSRLGEKMIHSSEGTKALARKLCRELDDKFLQHGLNSGNGQKKTCYLSYTVLEVLKAWQDLLQEDQNVMRRKERIQKQSSIISNLTRQLCIHDNLAASASTYSYEESPTIAGPSSGEVWRSAFDVASNGPNPSYGDSRSNGPSRRNSDPSQNGDINPGCRRTPNCLPPAPLSSGSIYRF